MEFAARAGAITTRFYGEADELLQKFERFVVNSKNRTWPVGTLKPNDFGLFDAQGHVHVWCHTAYLDYLIDSNRNIYKDIFPGGVIQKDARWVFVEARSRAALMWCV